MMRIALYAVLSNILIIGFFYWLDYPSNLPYAKDLAHAQRGVVSYIPKPQRS